MRDNGIGAPLTLTITGPDGNAVTEALELQLQAQWAACGVTLVIHNVTMTRLLSVALPEGRYQIALAPYVIPAFPTWAAIDYTDPVTPAPAPQETISLHGGTASPVTGGSGTVTLVVECVDATGHRARCRNAGAVTRDVTGLNQPGVGTDFEQIMVELNTQSEALLMSKLDGLLTHYLPTLPLFQMPVSLVQRSDIVNVSESPTSAGPMWDAEDWAIELTAPAGQ